MIKPQKKYGILHLLTNSFLSVSFGPRRMTTAPKTWDETLHEFLHDCGSITGISGFYLYGFKPYGTITPHLVITPTKSGLKRIISSEVVREQLFMDIVGASPQADPLNHPLFPKIEEFEIVEISTTEEYISTIYSKLILEAQSDG